MSVIVAKIVTALSVIEDDLAGKITPSEMNVNAALSMNGSALQNVGSIQLMAGNAPTSPGSFYYSGGEFYVVDAAGTIQITAAGSLNAALLGTIVGDYGGTNPARVTYNDATGEYRFTEDVGVWADLVCDDLVLQGTNGTVRIGVDPAINTARQLIIKSLPTVGNAFLVYNSATSTLEDGSVTPVTTLTVTTLNATNATIATGIIPSLTVGTTLAINGEITRSAQFNLGLDLAAGQWAYTASGGGSMSFQETGNQLSLLLNGSTDAIRIPCTGLQPGDRIQSITVGYTAVSFTPNYQVILDNGSQVTTSLATTHAGSDYTSTGAVHIIYAKYTVNSPTPIGNGNASSGGNVMGGKASIRIANTGGASHIYHLSVQYDRVSTPSATVS